ncbi:hypothetical protein D9M71_710960 [compost metagenome]
MSVMPNEMVSLALAPIWKPTLLNEPSSRLRPPKVVVLEIRVSSPTLAVNSCCRETRSASLLSPFADCRASSRRRCSRLVDSCIAPSAVCAIDTPLLALAIATFKPLTWLPRRLAICMPAASSLALLIFRPEDRRFIELLRASEALFRFF